MERPKPQGELTLVCFCFDWSFNFATLPPHRDKPLNITCIDPYSWIYSFCWSQSTPFFTHFLSTTSSIITN
jgi:hypothetical protein